MKKSTLHVTQRALLRIATPSCIRFHNKSKMICCNLQIHQIYVCTYCLISKNRHAYGKEGNNSWKSAFFLTSNKILSVCKIFYHLFSCVTSFTFSWMVIRSHTQNTWIHFYLYSTWILLCVSRKLMSFYMVIVVTVLCSSTLFISLYIRVVLFKL